MPNAQGETAPEGVGRFGAGSSIDDIRQFILERVPREPGPGTRSEPVRVTIRVVANEVEMRVGPAMAGAGESPSRFAEWFVVLLRDEGMTQQAAARRLGVSGKTVNRWVRGHTEPRLRELRRVQEVFGAVPPL